MDTLACGHVAHAGPSRLCRHLLNPEGSADPGYVRLLTGHGLDFDLCCTDCDKGTPSLVEVCEGCVAQYEDGDYGYVAGLRGEPGIAERPEPVDTTVEVTPLPDEFGTVTDFAPIANDDGRSLWLVLTGDGRLMRFDADAGTCEHVATCSVPGEPDHKVWTGHELRRRLHVAPGGRFAAVVNDFGRHGQVIDLADGRVTLTLDGGDYHRNTVPFSVAFADHGGRSVVVHRTAWNSLEVSDPASC